MAGYNTEIISLVRMASFLLFRNKNDNNKPLSLGAQFECSFYSRWLKPLAILVSQREKQIA